MVALKRYNNKPVNKRVDYDDDDEMENVTESESEPEPELESSDEEEEEEGGDVKLDLPSKTAIYNREGLLDQLRDLSWPENVEWIHKLTIDVEQEQEVDVNDDLARELAFYNQALEGTRMAFDKLQSMKISFLRPADYYAEMVKTDAHMVRVKGRLLEEKKKMEESEERRKARESKKIAKEVQAQKMKEKTKAKKDDFESVKKWRKQRQQSGFAGGDKEEEMMKLSFEDGKGFERSTKRRPGVSPGDRSGGKARQYAPKGKKGNDKKSKSRDHRDSKFGFGGKKGMRKQNTADTTDDMKGFNKGDFSGNKKRKRF